MQLSRSKLLSCAVLVSFAGTATAQNALFPTSSRSYPTGNQVLADAYRPEHTACADMDGDGDADLVIAHAGNIVSPKVSVMFNLGNGSFGKPMTYRDKNALLLKPLGRRRATYSLVFGIYIPNKIHCCFKPIAMAY